MSIKVKYFGMLAEITGKTEEELQLDVATIGELEKHVISCYKELAKANYVIAMNESLVNNNTPIISPALIAFLPPFAGG